VKPRTYGPFPYSPIIHRPRLEWPNGAHIAFWIIPNIEFFALHEPIPAATGTGGTSAPAPDVSNWAIRDYGNRVGVFRVMEVLDRLRYSRHGGAQQRPLRPASRDHRGRTEAQLGMDGAQREQFATP
jgi:hypothetical protein